MEFTIAYLLIFLIALFLTFKIIKVSFSILKKTVIMCLLFFILYAVFANAAADRIFSGFIFPYETLTVDKKPFTVSLEGHEKIMLKSGANYFFIDVGDCEEIYNLRFCFGNTRWDIDEKKEKINLTVYSIEPTIKITRTIDKSTLRVGEEAEIKTTILNSDTLSAENAVFTDAFTPEFEITDIFYCTKKNNTVYWKGYIRKNDSITCEYTIKALDEIERSFKAKLEYFDGYETQEEFSSPITIKINPLLDIQTEFNDTDKKIFTGQTVYLKINLTNKNDEDMNINYFDIYIPDGLEYLGEGTIKTAINSTDYRSIIGGHLAKIADNVYRFSYEIKRNNQSKILIPVFKAKLAGKSNIYMKMEYETGGETRIKEKIESIEVQPEEIRIHSNLKDSDEFDTGIDELVRVYIENPLGNNVYFKNLHIKFNTTLWNLSDVYIDRLNKSSTTYVLSKRLITPIVGKKTTYKFNVLADYETEYGEKRFSSLDMDIDIKPIAGISITQTISKSSVESGEEFDVEVKVKNERIEDINDVKVSDTIHNEFSRKGISATVININGLDTVSAYKYKMKAPQVQNRTVYKFVTNATYSKNNITKFAEKEFKITVNPKKLELTISRTTATPLFMGQIADVVYTIENKEDEQIRDILFKFPVQQDFDVLNGKSYWIEKLDPYEKLIIKDKHKIRPKVNESQVLEPTEFVYKDDLGNVFVKNSSRNSFDIKNSYIDGPAFMIYKNSSKTKINTSELFDVLLTVKNIGMEKSKIKIKDNQREWEFDLFPGEQTEVGYSLSFDQPGKAILSPAIGEYKYLEKNVTTSSNKLELEVGGAVKEKISPEEQTKEEVVVPEKTKGFFAQIMELYVMLKKAIFGG